MKIDKDKEQPTSLESRNQHSHNKNKLKFGEQNVLQTARNKGKFDVSEN